MFADAVFDEPSWSLTVKGRRIELEGKPLLVLLELLIHAGETVTREELLDAVWPDVHVVEASLTTAISKLRKAIDDAGGAVIQTVPKIGYRLVAPGQITDWKPLWATPRRRTSGGRFTKSPAKRASSNSPTQATAWVLFAARSRCFGCCVEPWATLIPAWNCWSGISIIVPTGLKAGTAASIWRPQHRTSTRTATVPPPGSIWLKSCAGWSRRLTAPACCTKI